MFEPRLLTEEEAQWRASCGWHVDESAVSSDRQSLPGLDPCARTRAEASRGPA